MEKSMVTFGRHEISLRQENIKRAIFYGLLDGQVIASAKVDPYVYNPVGALVIRPFISEVMVNPKHQHRGIGTMMMKHIMEELIVLRAPSCALYVHRDNLLAQKFYERLGFMGLVDDHPNIIFARELSRPL
jgi:ribosomal protein S18 acetylase RimI-like enzyme